MGLRTAALAALLSLPLPAAAQFVLSQDPRVELTGYVQALSGARRPPGALGNEWAGLHGGVVRLAWTGGFGDDVVVEVHQRLLSQVGSGVGVGGAGLGVSVVPERSFDLSTTLVEGEDTRIWHDLDRLSVTVYTGWADVTAGRQAITWGTAALFPVADLWGRFSPFEVDTQQKPGVDAVRALAYPAEGVELDLVVADAGSDEGVSAAGHVVLTRGWGDLRAGAGKFWDEAILLAGVTRVLEATTLRVEAALPYHLDRDRWEDPRITLGVDRPGVRWSWSGELHLNGLGAGEPEGYLEILQGEALARGESYLLGRLYAGGLVSWNPDEDGRARLSIAALGNLDDGSASLTPSASYDVGQSARLTLGGLFTVGDEPGLLQPPGGGQPVLRLRSEFGSYGRMAYLVLAVFF